MHVHDTTVAIIAKVLEVPADDLAPTMAFRALPNADSQRLLQVILEVENAFDIEIDDDATFRIETVGEFQAAVDELVRQPVPA